MNYLNLLINILSQFFIKYLNLDFKAYLLFFRFAPFFISINSLLVQYCQYIFSKMIDYLFINYPSHFIIYYCYYYESLYKKKENYLQLMKCLKNINNYFPQVYLFPIFVNKNIFK
jgi:hypothetical protein